MLKRILQSFLEKTGYKIIHRSVFDNWTKGRIESPVTEQVVDIHRDSEFMPLYEKSKSYTITSVERMYALHKATEYIIEAGVSGDIVECGVWRGGSMMMCAYTLNKLRVSDRNIYMYDTYQGMTAPSEIDLDYANRPAHEVLKGPEKEAFKCFAPVNDVRNNVYLTGYPRDRFVFIEGKVEDTIPGTIPEKIALLRLDTDWFNSTKHELEHLFPLLSVRGVLIIDDYGHWKGSQIAVDKYFNDNNTKILLCRVDYTCRIAIKYGDI